MRKLIGELWHNRLSRAFRGASRARRQHLRSLSPSRPRLELLEDRIAPTVSVTSPTSVTPGTQVTYTINYQPTNFAAGDSNVTITATLPVGFKALSATFVPNFPGGPTNPDKFSPPSISSVQGADVITFKNSLPQSVAALSADTFQIIAQSPSNLTTPPAAGTVTETSTQDTKQGVQVNEPISSPTVTPVASLSVTQIGPSSTVAGKNAFYTVTVTNNGPSDAQNVTLKDVLTNLTGGAAPTFDLGATKQLSGLDMAKPFQLSTGTFTETSVGAGNTDVFQFAVALPDDFVVTNPINPSIISTATVASSTTLYPNTDTSASQTTDVTASADLSVTKVGPPTIIAGNEATYTVTITNNGPSTAQGVTLTDALTGTGLSFDSALTKPLINPDGFVVTPLVTPNSQSAAFTAATMGAGSSDTFRVVVQTAPNAGPDGTSFSNTATVSSKTADAVQTNNTASVSTTLTNSAALSIVDTLASHVSPLTEGVPLTYDLTLTNKGPSDAQDVVVNFTLPAQLNAIAPIATLTNSATGQSIAGIQSGNVLTFTIPTVSGTAGKNTFSGTVTVEGVEDGTAISSATVTSKTPNTNAANNTSQTAPTVLEGNITLSRNTVSGTEFSALSGVTVASFTHANGLEAASAFTATINWGDGSTSPGSVSQPGGTGTAYIVQGSHTYLGDGNYSVTVNITDGNASVSSNHTASIGEAPLPPGTDSLPVASHVQETMENLFKAPLTNVQLNHLDLAVLMVELSIANQMMNSGMDPATTFFLTQLVGQNVFDIYAAFVSDHGTPLPDAVTDITTDLLIIGSNP